MNQVLESRDKCDRCGEQVTTKSTEHWDFDGDRLIEEGAHSEYKCANCGFEILWGEPVYAQEMNKNFRAEAVAEALKADDKRGKK